MRRTQLRRNLFTVCSVLIKTLAESQDDTPNALLPDYDADRRGITDRQAKVGAGSASGFRSNFWPVKCRKGGNFTGNLCRAASFVSDSFDQRAGTVAGEQF